jgi:integrase
MEDIGRLMGACTGDVPLLIETLFATGMRISEAAGLMVSDLNFEGGYMSVRRRDCRGDVGDTKSEKGRRVLAMGNLAEALRAHVAGKEPSGRVFTWHGEPIRDNVLLGKTITPIMENLGIKFAGFGWHTFRRLHLSLMSKKLSLFDLRHQAGHADIRTTAKYVADDRVARTAAAAELPKIEKMAPKPFIVRKKVG